MNIEIGTEFQISDHIKKNFNSADGLKVINQTGTIVQFTLKDHKGHGSMPLQHLEYLLKKKHLVEGVSKRTYLLKESEEENVI